MKIIITGACGFIGSMLAAELRTVDEQLEIVGLDNLSRPGSELNRPVLARLGVKLLHLDIRSAADVSSLPSADWIIDAAANASVLAGVDEHTSSRQLIEHNLLGTINLLEYCKDRRAGFILLSTSRVYSISALGGIRVEVNDGAFRPLLQDLPGLSHLGISEQFSTTPPLSLYGVAKFASERLALEYGDAFDFPVWINRCGVLAGKGQFGKADQGIFSFWIHSYRWQRPLKYIGFDGKGHQVRDCLHPRDLVPVLRKQLRGADGNRVCNFGGGVQNSISLRQLSEWCARRFGRYHIQSNGGSRPFDIPWLVLDASQAEKQWNWRRETTLEQVLEEIALHADAHPDWLDLSR
jgi:CDP-paratose 2-epimerase